MNTNELTKTAHALRVMARQLRQAALVAETEAEYVEAAGHNAGQLLDAVRSGRRWADADDSYLLLRSKALMAQGVRGDALAEALAVELKRSVAGVAARLVKVGVWE